MFDQIANQLAAQHFPASPTIPPDLASNKLLEEIVRRLDRDVPPGPYLTDKWLAQILGIELKTLMNRRSVKPGRYPRPMHMVGVQGGLHVRSDLIDWLAREEMQAKTRHVHVCN